MKPLHKEKKAVNLVLPAGGQMPKGEGFSGPAAIQGYKFMDGGIFNVEKGTLNSLWNRL